MGWWYWASRIGCGAEEFWCAALGDHVRDDGFGGWGRVLVPAGGTGATIALRTSQTN